jgi:hypothetical protein
MRQRRARKCVLADEGHGPGAGAAGVVDADGRPPVTLHGLATVFCSRSVSAVFGCDIPVCL